MATTAQNARCPAAWRSMPPPRRRRQIPIVCHIVSAISIDHIATKKVNIAERNERKPAVTISWLASTIANAATMLLTKPTTQ